MRSQLAVLIYQDRLYYTASKAYIARSKNSGRGLHVNTIIWMRQPTPEEFIILYECMSLVHARDRRMTQMFKPTSQFVFDPLARGEEIYRKLIA